MSKVGIVMGSDSDLSVMKAAMETLEKFGIEYDVTVISAHRMPDIFFEYAKSAESKYDVLIAGAGGAAHLPGMAAAITPIPVIGSTVIQTAVNGLGSVYVAAITAGNKVSLLFTQPYDTIGTAMATFCGQNLGARKLDRIHKGMKQGIIAMGVYTVFAFLAIVFAGRYVALLFVNADQVELLGYVDKFLFANAAFYFPLGLLMVLRYAIQGLGHSLFAMLAGIMEMIARCAVAFIGIVWFGVDAIYYSNATAWIAANIFLIPAFIMVMKKIENNFKMNGTVNG